MSALKVTLLLVAVTLSGCVAELPGTEAQSHSHDSHDDHDASDEGNHSQHADASHMHAQTGMARPHYGGASGEIPDADRASKMEQRSSIRIIGDEGFRPGQGVREGSGTPDDPYIIEHWYVAGDLYIQDTDACFIVRENWVGGQLSLNFNGLCVYVHHNYVNDLRVNENIRREGYVTGGLMEHNKIGFIGQLRHYDGEFASNEVGPRPDTAPWDAVLETTPLLAANLLVANVDGFNQGLLHNNTFHGTVDLDFHGHHHGTGFYATHSHYHGDNESREMGHDHTKRWTSVKFVDNHIIDELGYGLRYEDRNHAGDDRVANSEQEETLALSHTHRTMVDIIGNKVEGSIWVDVFNADDQKHEARNDGWLTIAHNEVQLVERDQGPLGIWSSQLHNTGILVQSAKEVELVIAHNELSFEAAEGDAWGIIAPVVYPTAIAVERMHDANITIQGNAGDGFHTGIRALRFDEAAWTVRDNHLDAEVPLDADDSVPMPDS